MPATPAVGAVEDTCTVANAERVDVCIIGAGLAGLACARQLVRRGIRVCVVEARDRVGGRSYSPVDEAFGDVIDLGGQFFGGPIQPLTLDLIHELGLESQLEPQAFFGDGPTGGGSISLGAADAADYVGLEAEIEALSAVVTAPSGEGEEWLVGGSSARARELDAISVARWVATRQAQGGLGTAAAREFLLLVQTVLAADPEQLSFLGLLSFFQACGGMAKVGDGPSGAQAFRLKGGAQRIADEAAAALVRAQGPGVLRLSSAVTTVAYSLSGAHVEVRCVHGTVVCRAAVIAVPPPLWSGGVNFEPPLPPAKSTVASQLVRGRAVKVVVAYESNFWTGAPAPPAALEELGPIANLFPSSVGGKPALVGLATGSAAAALGALGAREQEAAVTDQLAQFFAAAAARQPRAIRVIDWSCEAWGAGCFACVWPPGLATSVALGGTALAAPVHGSEGGAVFFAATELAHAWPGYFEGALDAGYRAATEAANFLGDAA